MLRTLLAGAVVCWLELLEEEDDGKSSIIIFEPIYLPPLGLGRDPSDADKMDLNDYDVQFYD